MLMKLFDCKRVIASAMIFAFAMYNTSLAVAASEINQNGVPFQTATTINQNGNIFNISTTTTNGAGNIGINSFGRFNVDYGDIVNLNLINSQNKLVNLIFDSSASQINGVVNSYMNGQIGGNVLFANPNGFVVGQSGVFNVGALTLITPTEDFMKNIFSGGITNPNIVDDNLNSLITFNMKGEDYLLLGGGAKAAVKLNPKEIKIDGTINSGSGISVINGGNEINIGEHAKLNANMNFSGSGANVVAVKKDKSDVTPTTVQKTVTGHSAGSDTTELEYKLAMDGGNGITIISQNQKTNEHYLSAIVNLNGKLDANGSDVLTQTEIYNTGIGSASEYDKDSKHDVALSKVAVGGNIAGRDVVFNARTEATNVNNKLLGSEEVEENLGFSRYSIENWLISDFFNMADMKSSVEVLNGANIIADRNVTLNAVTSFVASTKSIFENIALNYTDVDIVTESILRSGSNVNAENLNVLSTTNMQLTTSAQASNLAEMAADAFDKSFGHGGAYAISVVLADVENRAVVENAVNLAVAKNITVDAEMYRSYTGATKNGLVPVLDRNYGPAGIMVGFFNGNTVNEAVMESNADIAGTLDVEANYIGSTNNTIAATALNKGQGSQTGMIGNIYMYFYDMFKMKYKGDSSARSYTRANGVFDKIKIAGALGISIDNVKNKARIGNNEKNVKPTISAGNIVLKSKLTDNKSLLYASSTATEGATAGSGAVAINVKNLDSNAEAYGDFTVKSGSFEYIGQKDGDYILLEDGTKRIVNDGEKIIIDYPVQIYVPDTAYYKDSTTGVDYTITDDKITIKQGEAEYTVKKDNIITSGGKVYIDADDVEIKDGKAYIKDGDNRINLSNKTYEKYSERYLINLDIEQTKITLPDGKTIDGKIGDKVAIASDGFVIKSDTIVKHGLSYGDWLPDALNWVDGLFDTLTYKADSILGGNTDKIKSVDNQDAGSYLSAAAKAEDIQNKIDGAGNLNILNAIDFNVAGLAQLFNTFAASSATAETKEGATAGYSGAISVAVHNTISKAILHDNSSVLFKAENNANNNSLNISAYTNDQLWSGAAMMGIFNNVGSGGAGNSARDGDSKGGAISFQWGSPDTIANIGKNVKVQTDDGKPIGDVNVKALDETDDINVAIANGAADESGLSGAISISAIDAGKVEAAIMSSGANGVINGKNVNVTAKKDLTHVNANAGATAAQDAKGIGIAINYADDEAVSYIAGNVKASNDVTVTADYDKLFVNGAINFGYAKTGTDTPKYGDVDDEHYENIRLTANLLFGKAEEAKNSKLFNNFKSLWQLRKANELLDGANYDFTRAINADKNTAAKAGMMSVSISDAVSRAYIADGAKVQAGNDITVKATSEDKFVNGALALAMHGKSGFGGAFIGQYTENEVEAYIGNAIVDASNKIKVEADEEIKLFAGSAGVAQGSDKSTAGNISLDIQNNKVTAAIKDGAKINTLTDTANQSVDVTAGVTSQVIKGVGSVSLNMGSGGNSEGAKGGTLDGDIAVNKINAYIKNAQVNAGKEINVEATNKTYLTTVDVAGAISQKDSAYSGTLGAYVSINEENAYIEDSNINKSVYSVPKKDANNNIIRDNEGNIIYENKERSSKDANIKVNASSYFDDLAVVGTLAVGKGSSRDLSARTDGIGDVVNSYIKNSVVNTGGKLEMGNNLTYNYLAVTASGSVSFGSDDSALSGAIAVAVNNGTQNNYIENSTIDAKELTMDTNSVYDTTAATGVLAISAGSGEYGASVYVSIVDNAIETYIKNSNITTLNDINMSSDLDVDSLSVIFAGTGGKGLALAGAISAVINDADVKTYILSENNNIINSTSGKLDVKSTTKNNIDTINGTIALAFKDSAVGVAINTLVDSSDTTAYIQGANITKAANVDVGAKTTEDIMSWTAGFAAGKGMSASGSVNTVVIDSDVNSKIEDSIVESDNDVNVTASDDIVITGGTGAVAVSVADTSIGAAVVTGVIDDDVKAEIINSKIKAADDVLVSAIANESIGTVKDISKNTEETPYLMVAGGGSKDIAVDGVIATMVVSSSAEAYITGTKTVKEVVDNVEKDVPHGVDARGDVKIEAKGDSVVHTAVGALGAAGSVGVGATINTMVVDKDIYAEAKNTKIKANGITINAAGKDEFKTNIVAAGVGLSSGAAGVVNTNVITSRVKAIAENTELNATENINIDSKAQALMNTVTGTVGAGTNVGFGVSFVNDVIKYTVHAYIDNSKTAAPVAFDSLNINAQSNNTYSFSTISGGFGGTGGGAGVENVNYVKNDVKAYSLSDISGRNAIINAKDKVTFENSYSGVAAGGGTAGVGATVEVNEVKSTVNAYIGGENVRVNDISITASGEQIFDGIVAAGFSGAGTVALTGTALANIVDTEVNAYVADGTNIYKGNIDEEDFAKKQHTNSLTIQASNKTYLTESIGALAFSLAGSAGATVGVNKFSNRVSAFTGDNAGIKSKDITIDAKSYNNMGKRAEDGKKGIVAVAGAGGIYVGLAGTVLYNSVEDVVNAHVGKNNIIRLAQNGKLDVKAADTTEIFGGVGSVGGGAAGMGASVDYNAVENTVIAYIGEASDIKADASKSANISVVAESQEMIDKEAYVVSGGAGALSGGVVYSSIGKKVKNASYKDFSEEDKENFESAEKQKQSALNTADEKKAKAETKYNEAYNDALNKVKNYYTKQGASTENNNGTGTEQSNPGTSTENSNGTGTESSGSGSSATSTYKLFSDTTDTNNTPADRIGTTSAYIDTEVKIEANDVTVNAKNSDNVELQTVGAAGGAVGVGVSIAVSDNDTTTNAFIQNNVKINANSLTLKSESVDAQNVKTCAATGGIVAGSGSAAYINSDKTTNAYINENTNINTNSDILLSAISKATGLDTTAYAAALGKYAAGVSLAHTTSIGDTKIDIGKNVSLISTEGNIAVKTDADEKAHSDAWAATGALVNGTGADSVSNVGKDTTINIEKDFTASAQKGNLNLLSNAKNDAFAESNGRAYGGISVGGTKTKANINHTSGVNIADATTAKTIKAKEIDISSIADNKAKATTYAGAGAAVGIAGSGVYSVIDSKNNIDIGKKYDITAEKYTSCASTKNDYLSYNKSNAYGVAALAIPFIENTIDSTVTNKFKANIESDSSIVIAAANEVVKKGVDGYDLYGGSGGLASGSGGYINDNVTLTTETDFGGDRANAMGNYGGGAIDISAYNIANIDEKADLYSHGGIAGADMDSKVELKATADVKVSNKKITTKDDHITYAARNDVDIYAKSNVESYGGVAGAGGEASAIASQIAAAVTFEEGTHSISGRDTNISAVSNKKLVSSIYTRTRGLVSALNDEANAKSQDSKAYVYINGNGDDNTAVGNALIEAFDSINITAQNTYSTISADRDSKAYQLWCIPYTGEGNKNTQNSMAGGIVLNGILKSGLGYNKSLHINKDGNQVDENGNVVENGTYGIYANKKEIGSITTSDMREDVQAYEKSKESVERAFEDYKREAEEEIGNYREIVTNNTTEKRNLEAENVTLNGKVRDAGTDKEADSTLLTNLTNANNDITKLEGSASQIQEYEEAYGSLGNEYINALISTIKAYHAADSEHQAERYDEYIAAKNDWNSHYADKSAQLNLHIQELEAKIANWNRDISNNENRITECQNAIDANGQKITIANNDLQEKEAQKNIDVAKLDAKIEEINQKIIAGDPIKVYVIDIDDVIIRSGKITFNGDAASITHVSGNGYIHAPGENASINIINDSVSNIVFNKLVINSNLKGGVAANNATIDGTIHNIVSGDQPSMIKIVNTVDANDPTVDFESNAGDMLFKGDVENPLGEVNISNSTGDVIVNAGLIAGNLNISVPNGGFEKPYSKDVLQVTGNGIVAGGDISISSLVIDVNGLIKSGTEIKEVTIPDFTIKKVGNDYYQVAGGVETLLTESSTSEGYYYLKLFDEENNLDVLKGIKAYFKPNDLNATGDNISGDVILFKANTIGGNITLTGNIINTDTGNNAKIELMNGYGHINIVNNSVHNLVTSSLNADTEARGVLTINDFMVGTSDSKPEYSNFDVLTQSPITQEFLDEYTGTYTLKVGDDGVMNAEAKNKTDGNGSWGSQNATTTLTNGAKVYSTTYTPGDDAYYVKKEGDVITQRIYVKRSWIVELFDGKKYVDCSYVTAPEYGVAKNPIAVNFVGYDSPEINITSKGNVILDNSISALPGTINIKSEGNIISNSMSNIISGRHIDLDVGLDGIIGEYDSGLSTIKPIQVAIYGNGGLLNARGKDIYLNYPKTDISDINIFSNNGSVYLGSDTGKLDMKDKHLFGITGANNLELEADSINLNPADMAEGGGSNIVAKNWIVRAKDDIYIENSGDIVAEYIVSENNGKVSLISKNGSILAGETGKYSTKNIHAGNIVLSAVNGAIGASDKALKFANSAVYNVIAKDDIYLDSKSKMYIDRVTSNNGSVNLNSKFGIIASKITTDKSGKSFTYNNEGQAVYADGEQVSADDMRVYNISSKKDINLVTIAGNVENITVDTDGVINAVAGYNNADLNGSINTSDVADAVSDVNITLLSKELPSATVGTEVEDYLADRKNMNIGRIYATQNVTLSSEGAVLKADDSAGMIVGDSITINAVGNVGQEEDGKGLTFGTNGEVSIYTKAGSDVYIGNAGNLKIRRIDVTNNIVSGNDSVTYGSESANSLNKVKIISLGDITNAAKDKEINDTVSTTTLTYTDEETQEIMTENIDVKTQSIEEVEQNIPNIRAAQIDLKTFGKIGDYNKDIVVETTAQPGLEYMAGAFGSENAYIRSIGDTLYVNSGSSSNTRISTNDTNIVASDINANNITLTSESGNIVANNIVANTSGDNVVTLATKGNAVLTDATADKIIVNAVEATVDGNINSDSLNITANNHGTVSAIVNYLNDDADKSADLVNVLSYGDVTLKDANINGNATITARHSNDVSSDEIKNDINIENTKVSGDAIITALNDVKIADADINGDLNITTTLLNIEELKLDGNINAAVDKADITTSNNLNVGIIQGNTQTYTDNLSIVAENIKNGTGTDDNNIYAKDIDLTANDSIGTRNTSLNVNLPEDNTIAAKAANLINIRTNGVKPNYTNVETNEAIISSDTGIVIKNIDVDYLDIKTASTDVDLQGKVNKRGNIRTKDKRVSINNENLEPDYYATAQLHTTKNPFKLLIDASKNIKVRSKYVVRHNQGILINGTDFLSSMESEAIKSAELSLKNSNRKKGLIEDVDEKMYDMSTVSGCIDKLVYPDNTGVNIGLITTLAGEKVNESNILDVINTKMNLQSLLIENDSNKKADSDIYNMLGYVR